MRSYHQSTVSRKSDQVTPKAGASCHGRHPAQPRQDKLWTQCWTWGDFPASTPRASSPQMLVRSRVRSCRLQPGVIWDDPDGRYRIGCNDAADRDQIRKLVGDAKPTLAIHDPPYNLVAFDRRSIGEFIEWCRKWIRNTTEVTATDASLYVWLGADQNDGFQPPPHFIVMMRDEPYKARSFITMRNQRGYGTQRNWMAVRQELLYYIKGSPLFNVDAEYTDIPRSCAAITRKGTVERPRISNEASRTTFVLAMSGSTFSKYLTAWTRTCLGATLRSR
jgi:hypothetical protein